MSVNYETLTFWDAYSVAEDIRIAIQENPENETFDSYFDITDQATRFRIAAAQRWTLLHQFVSERYLEDRVFGFEEYRNDMPDLVVEEYEMVLKGYGIYYDEVILPEESSNDYDQKGKETICYLRSLLPIRQIVNETFQLLFGNRAFLLKFNKIIAKPISTMKFCDHPDILNKDGIILRRNLPVWAKRGVFYRDRGRCTLCGKDLTGSVVTGEEAHYDHIIPLAQGGTNDPVNFQLLCANCNLGKFTQVLTSDRYPVYWSLEEKG